MALGLGGGGIFRERLGQADRFGAQIIFDQAISRGGRVTFGKKQIENFEHRAQPLVKLLGIGNFAAKRLVANHSLGAHQPLRRWRSRWKEMRGQFPRLQNRRRL